MRFLVDDALSPLLASRLRQAGHDAVPVRYLNMQIDPDDRTFAQAADEGRVLVSADTDFGTLLANRRASSPSVVLFRRGAPRRPEEQAMLLLANLTRVEDALGRGSIVVSERSRLRIRTLPLP